MGISVLPIIFVTYCDVRRHRASRLAPQADKGLNAQAPGLKAWDQPFRPVVTRRRVALMHAKAHNDECSIGKKVDFATFLRLCSSEAPWPIAMAGNLRPTIRLTQERQ